MKWVPEWAKSYTISRKACNDASINIYFYESTEYGEKPISELAKDLAINDVCQQIRERTETKRSKYHREIKPGVFVDVYDILRAYGIKCHAIAHAIKKLLMPGERGHKDYNQDCEEAIQSIRRSIDEHV